MLTRSDKSVLLTYNKDCSIKVLDNSKLPIVVSNTTSNTNTTKILENAQKWMKAIKEKDNKIEEPKKKTKTERIMEFFSPPEEEQEVVWGATQKRAQFPMWIAADLVSVEPMSKPNNTIFWNNYISSVKVPDVMLSIEEDKQPLTNNLKYFKNVR